VQLRTEEVDPEIPVRWDPQESLAQADEGGCLRDRVRREVVQLHTVVVAQPAHEAARRRREAMLVVADKADDVAERRVGPPVRRRRDDPRRGCPSTFGASWLPFTSSLKANRVTVERFHGSGSTTMIAFEGAMSIGGRRGDEANARIDEGARGALERKRGIREQWTLSVEVKNSPLPPLGFIGPWEPCSLNRALRAH
jgi:hypothetical protein